tara:strand:- start:430 stop:1857 length:1428 start_codon:yes stop_codon:yes gene_type:complete
MAITKVTSSLTDLDGGITIDNITIDGTEIDLSSGDLTIDVAGSITLDSDGGVIDFDDAGTNIGRIENASSDFKLESRVQNKDIVFVGNDAGTGVEALRLDMSDAGAAFFNSDVYVDRYFRLRTTDDQTNQWLLYTNTNDSLEFNYNGSGNAEVVVDTSGNVGIGNTTPSSAYSFADDLVVGSTSGAHGISIVSQDNTNGALHFTDALANDDGAASYVGYVAYNHASNYMFFGTSSTERMRIGSGGEVGIGSNNPQRLLHLYANSSGDTAVMRIQENGSHVAGIELMTGHGNWGVYNSDTVADALEFRDDSAGATRMLIDSSGNLIVGDTSAPSGSNSCFQAATGGTISISRAATNAQNMAVFYNPNGAVGSIKTNGSATSYNTSSDYRLKENVVTDWDATSRLKQLKPSRFNFKVDPDTTLDGFLAHEVSSIVPEAVSGEKDGEEMQGIDQSKLVPLLVKTIQELEARITTLEGE